MRHPLLCAMVVCFCLLAGAQKAPAPAAAPIPTPAQLDQAIEDFARQLPAGITADRYAAFAVQMPADEAEYKALNKHALVVVAALSKDASELPLLRVYLEQEKGTLLLPLIASVASEMPAESAAGKLMGTHRVDAYYLVPLGAWRQPGTLLADFAANRKEFILGKFPQEIKEEFIRNDELFNPAPGETIAVADIRRILERAAPDKKWGEAGLAPIACLMVAPDDPYPLCARVGPPPGTPPMGKRIRVSAGVLQGMQTKMVPPMAPLEVLKQHPGGVSVQVIVGEDGKVKDVQVLSGDATVAAIVVAAVRQWRFRPFKLNGKPLEVESQLTFDMGTKPGKLVHMEPPSYPPAAKAAGIEGTVVFRGVIGTDGKVKGLQVVSGPPQLVDAAREAVLKWRYEPYTVAGEPVEVETEIKVMFQLHGGG